MNWFSDPCRRRRPDLALLAARALPESENAALESHLATCPTCERYYTEINSVAATLATGTKATPSLEPSKAAEVRWNAAIRQAAKTDSAISQNIFLQDFWHELVLPCRRAVVGVAGLWLLILIANSALFAQPTGSTMLRTGLTTTIWQDYAAQRQFLAELMGSKTVPVAEPPRRNLPRPRGELPSVIRLC